jgi:hypothetical protein
VKRSKLVVSARTNRVVRLRDGQNRDGRNTSGVGCDRGAYSNGGLAQSALAGTVKDSSAGVLPGVAVEATSPALIEKVRTVVTDGTGQYRIEDLRPKTYTITFSLEGFSTLKRTGIELTGAFTSTINAELKVGALCRNGHRVGRHSDRGRPERASAVEQRRRQGHANLAQFQRAPRGRTRPRSADARVEIVGGRAGRT